MKYIKLKCEEYDCETEFLIALNDWYNKEYSGKILDFYTCPICDSLVFADENNIVEIEILTK